RAGERGDVVGVEVHERLVGGQAAVARAGQRRVGAAPAGGEDRVAATVELGLLAAAVLAVGRGVLGLGLDVDAPAGQARGQPRVLALAADRQRELVVGDDDRRLARVVVDAHLAHAGGAQRLGAEAVVLV